MDVKHFGKVVLRLQLKENVKCWLTHDQSWLLYITFDAKKGGAAR